MKKIEILAPAGSREAMEAAIEAGCDALYIGGSSFGARAYADNLSEAELLEAIDDVHLHGKYAVKGAGATGAIVSLYRTIL